MWALMRGGMWKKKDLHTVYVQRAVSAPVRASDDGRLRLTNWPLDAQDAFTFPSRGSERPNRRTDMTGYLRVVGSSEEESAKEEKGVAYATGIAECLSCINSRSIAPPSRWFSLPHTGIRKSGRPGGRQPPPRCLTLEGLVARCSCRRVWQVSEGVVWVGLSRL
jgi:hypothetical protein